ncbi:MAG TPA: peptidylprolyl isomerase [Symbiobacteriaceae bacterium]|nr:peptidylprolyl isomerase [Symbiobacteriaceae bacterium]
MAKQWSAPPAMQIDPAKTYHATVKTTKGDIRIELLAGESPKTVNNFVFLAREGFYEGVKFHRVIETFMIQTGDPTGTGAGGPGYKFADELPPRHPYEAGMVAMANAGPNTNGSQFFICSGSAARGLDRYPNYSQFGRVVSGMDVVHALARVPVGASRGGEMSKPLEEIKIESVTIEES